MAGNPAADDECARRDRRRQSRPRSCCSHRSNGGGGISAKDQVHGKERFLLCPDVYRREGLEQTRFPPNSGDLNPIETVWARLRKDLAAREQEDLRQGKVLTAAQFKLRAAQILQSYSIVKLGERKIYYQKLARGMTRWLQACLLNAYGRCGK